MDNSTVSGLLKKCPECGSENGWRHTRTIKEINLIYDHKKEAGYYSEPSVTRAYENVDARCISAGKTVECVECGHRVEFNRVFKQ